LGLSWLAATPNFATIEFVAKGGGIALAVLSAVALPRAVIAQEFDAEQFRANSPGDTAFFSVQTATPQPARTLSLGVRTGFALDPLVAIDTDNDRQVGAVMSKRAFAEISAAVSFGTAEIWAALPVILYQRSEAEAGVMLPLRADKSGLGDVRIGGRWRFYGDSDGVALALTSELTLPTHARAELSGEDGLSLSPRLAMSYQGETSTLAFNIGMRLRPSERLGDLRMGTAFTYAVAAAYDLQMPLSPSLIVELVGEVGAGEEQEAPVEVRGGFRFFEDLAIGYGHGLARGYGSPDHRVFVLLSHTFGGDADDGEAKPLPTRDTDPDHDGVLGADDDCPSEAEDKDAHLDFDGCPDPDNDNDGVADASDGCPLVAEDRDGIQDTDGCPDNDNDEDGIPDDGDDCPSKPEIINGNNDEDGCPDTGRQFVFVEETRLRVDERITFDRATSTLTGGAKNLLGQVARTILRYPKIGVVEIHVHTDARLSDAENLALSQRRATTIREALMALGVPDERLQTTGFGRQKPLSSSKTAEGRARNERVEFIIVPAPKGGKP
jgi:outer membrane protein OmpA-like peptidoglycan-associated protein